MRFERLSITGHRGEPVPNEFVRQDNEPSHLAVLLPGFGYTCDMPLFYYAESMLLDAGADIFRIEYAYNRREGFLDLPQDEQRSWLFDDVSAAFSAAISQRSYNALTLVGKSLGTLAMGHLSGERPRRARAIWLTPLLHEADLVTQMREFDGRSFIAIGDTDHHFDEVQLRNLEVGGVQTIVVNGADHSLDIPNDAVASVRTVEQVLGALERFLHDSV